MRWWWIWQGTSRNQDHVPLVGRSVKEGEAVHCLTDVLLVVNRLVLQRVRAYPGTGRLCGFRASMEAPVSGHGHRGASRTAS